MAKAIEAEPELCIALARNKESLERFMTRIQMEIVTEDNKDSIGNVIFAIKQINTVFDTAIVRGNALIEKQNQSK